MTLAQVVSNNIAWFCGTLILMTIIIAFSMRSVYKDKREMQLRDQIDDLKRKIGILTLPLQQMDTAFQAVLVKQLTHFHTPKLDALLTKLDPFTLTDDEYKEMVVELQQRERDMSDEIDDSERIAAQILPMIIRRVALQREQGVIVNRVPDQYDLALVAVLRSRE